MDLTDRLSRRMKGIRMSTNMRRLVGLCAVSVLMTGGLAAAADDLRLVTAAADQDRAAVQRLLKERVDVNARRADGVTALLWAAHWNDLAMADLLLRAGANVNAADDYNVTALARAAENASPAMVEKLLQAGASPNAAQTSGLTPLMIAAKTGSVELVKALLAHGANVNAATTETNSTAVMWAIAEPHPEVARVLIEGSATVNTSTTKGFTPLMFAARNGDVEMAKILLAAGVDVNATGADGTHVLPYAVALGKDEFALFLLEQGANPNGKMDGVQALHAAAGTVIPWLGDWGRRHGAGQFGGYGGGARLSTERRLALVKALLAHGADPNARITTSAMFMNYIGYPKKGAFEPFACGTGDLYGATPLWVAAYTANGTSSQVGFGLMSTSESTGSIIQALLAAGADQHITTNDGTTPFMVAAGLGKATYTPRKPRGDRAPDAEEAVKVLLEAGANINAVNEADFTALHGAAYRGLNEVVEFLVEHGANIDARDFRGRTPYRLAEGSKQSFQFQDWPETAALLEKLGADTRLGVPGTVQERARDLAAAAQQQQQ